MARARRQHLESQRTGGRNRLDQAHAHLVAEAIGLTGPVSDEGVRVNGALLPASAPRAVDGAGRALPRFRSEPYTLGATEVLLMSDASRTAFDARYFGPLPRAQIRAVLAPVLTW